MTNSSYDILQNMLLDFQTEQSELQHQLNQNLERIREAEYYLKTIYEKEDSEFKMFSPRNVENVQKDEIERTNSEIEKYRKENIETSHSLHIIETKIQNLKKVLDDEKQYTEEGTSEKREYHILEIQEADRQRIARDLHDTALQNLTYLIHKIELSGMFIDQDPLRAKLELSVISKNLKSVIEEIRSTIFDLRPMTFDDLGLKETIERLIDVINENKRFRMEVDIDNVSCENNSILLNIYRVVQECFSNIVKHAEADHIIFRCKQDDKICRIEVTDNGKGFSADQLERKKDRHFGLSVVRERVNLVGGKFEVHSELEKGTSIKIEIPLE